MLIPARFLRYLLFVGLLLRWPSAWAQVVPPASVAPHGYDFLTVMAVEGYTKTDAKLLITPAFQGKTELQLEDLIGSSFYSEKNRAIIQQNTLLINQQLSDLTSAGWELVEVHPILTVYSLVTTRYLFRKAKS